MDIIEQTKQTYCSAAGADAFTQKEVPYQQQRAETVYSILNDINLEGLRVLDVGCGYGRDVEEFRARGAEAYGIDISAELLAKANGDPAWFYQADLLAPESLPFTEKFDLIWAYAFFVHVPRADMPRILKKLWQQLADGGRLVVITKAGTGEAVKDNLGHGLERLMVYYQKSEILSELHALGAVEDKVNATRVTLPTGDELMFLRAIKKV